MWIGKKQLSRQRKEWNNNVYLLVEGFIYFVEGSGSMGLHTTLLYLYSCFFSQRTLQIGVLCVRLYQLGRPPYLNWTNVQRSDFWATFNEKRKILLNPVQQCKLRALLKFPYSRNYVILPQGNKISDKIAKKRKAVIIKRDFNLKYINKCTMNSQDRKCTKQPPEGCSFHTLDSCATFQEVVKFSLLMTVIAHLPKIGL